MTLRKYAIIVAGGKGLRMNSSIPKQFMILKGIPVLMHTVNAFFNADSAIKIILVIPEVHVDYWNSLVKNYAFNIPHQVVTGGDSRFQSVKNGLESILDDGVVAIHDGVRPLIDGEIINNSYTEAQKLGSAITVVPSKDSIRVKDGIENSKAVDRSAYFLVQTPQSFKISSIKAAYQQGEKHGFTDDASVYESNGGSVNLIVGSYSNIKITTPEDIAIADILLKP